MTSRSLLHSEVEIDAVLSSIKMPAEALAGLAAGDHIDLEAQGSTELTVRLVADSETIAVASLTLDGDRLVATILKNGPGGAGKRIDQWKNRKARTTA